LSTPADDFRTSELIAQTPLVRSVVHRVGPTPLALALYWRVANLSLYSTDTFYNNTRRIKRWTKGHNRCFEQVAQLSINQSKFIFQTIKNYNVMNTTALERLAEKHYAH